MSTNSYTVLVPTFLGVTLAFLLDRIVDLYKDRSDRKLLLRSIKIELNENQSRLEGYGRLVDKDIWDSGVASGKIQLLCSEQLLVLSKLYHTIENYNYEAKRCRDAAEEARSIPRLERRRKQAAESRHKLLSDNLVVIETSLNQNIKKILEEPFW